MTGVTAVTDRTDHAPERPGGQGEPGRPGGPGGPHSPEGGAREGWTGREAAPHAAGNDAGAPSDMPEPAGAGEAEGAQETEGGARRAREERGPGVSRDREGDSGGDGGGRDEWRCGERIEEGPVEDGKESGVDGDAVTGGNGGRREAAGDPRAHMALQRAQPDVRRPSEAARAGGRTAPEGRAPAPAPAPGARARGAHDPHDPHGVHGVREGRRPTPEDAVGKGRAAAPPEDGEGGDAWDDGLIARRVNEKNAAQEAPPAVETRSSAARRPAPLAYDGRLRSRLDALRELVGLSRTRLDSRTLTEASRVLEEAAARRRLSGQHTVVALAGATGSGKSALFNALAGVAISETGVRRPTTAAPLVCSWSDGAAPLIDRLGIPGRLRRRPVQGPDGDPQLRGLVLVDLPDHDSAAVEHREQVDRVLALVDAVIWVVDPEKYADAVLHERYLRPMAGHAEVMFLVLNQVDRLPGEAAEQVLDDLRRLLDEDGVALGEYGEPGATVLPVSALTGDGIGELREALGQFVSERGAPGRRVSADVDAAAARLRPVYTTGLRAGLSENARDEFAARLADAVGATAAGEAAERAWLRNANRACGTPWLRLWRWYQDRREPPTGRLPLRAPADEEATARQRVEQAVRTVADRAATGLPAAWAQAVREAAVRGANGLPEALDALAVHAGAPPGRPPRPGWWPAAVLAQASMTLLQVVGGLWLLGQIIGFMSPNLGVPVLLMALGIVGGPVVEWSCRMAARGPARRYGLEAERRLREAAAGCGRARVLDPVASELLRYREVREQYARVTGAVAGGGAGAAGPAGAGGRGR
ncbi:50S ribosome-binding GTPase [Streptomyces griseoaurantiacus]|uniref:50S ribosome-binding GTPase n=1 Tax=Streptomyces griseoaurantiacus TaxID=68213 RepID=A0A1G7BJM0_9ACTN|nr:50S ribosome-binding GTPase [Streptomyces jietaisiensis]